MWRRHHHLADRRGQDRPALAVDCHNGPAVFRPGWRRRSPTFHAPRLRVGQDGPAEFPGADGPGQYSVGYCDQECLGRHKRLGGTAISGASLQETSQAKQAANASSSSNNTVSNGCWCVAIKGVRIRDIAGAMLTRMEITVATWANVCDLVSQQALSFCLGCFQVLRLNSTVTFGKTHKDCRMERFQ